MGDTYQAAQKVIVDRAQAGQRLDNFLFAQFRRLPKARIYRMMRKGEVRVNGGRKQQSYRIKAGDELRLPPVRVPVAGQPVPIRAGDLRAVANSILFEDEAMMVLNKPAGLAVHAGSGVDYGVIEVLRGLRPDETFLELVHRLDRGTSGCLLLAKSRAMLNALHQLWRVQGVDKQYLALVAGRWQGGGRTVDFPLQRRGEAEAHRHTCVSDDGKVALSRFEPVNYYKEATLLRVTIDTGRTHQIRVHAAELGYPLLGDDRYGDFALNRQWRKKGLKRMFLHAENLRFQLPGEAKSRRFHAPLPCELQRLLETLNG